MNIIILSGRTVRDIEAKDIGNGRKVANFTLAVDRRTSDGKAWGKTADVLAKYAPKGKQIAVTGELQTRSYEDREGNKRKAYEVSVEKIELIGGKPEGDAGAETKKPISKPESVVEAAGNLPFEL